MPESWDRPADGRDAKRLTVLTQSAERKAGLAESTSTLTKTERLERLDAALRNRQVDTNLADIVRSSAAEGLSMTAQEEEPLLKLRHAIGLEAVVIADGTRPSLPVVGGKVDPRQPEAGAWSFLGRFQSEIQAVLAATGKILAPVEQGFAGTCLYVAEGVVLTNRHVAEAIADEANCWALRWPNETLIDFVAEDNAPPRMPWTIDGVLFAGPDRIGTAPSLGKLDAALLRCRPSGACGADGSNPAPLRLDSGGAFALRESLFATGIPARPSPWPKDETPPPRYETRRVIGEIFADMFGIKRLAPGRVTSLPADIEGGMDRVFGHDCTTLAGSSGSGLFDLARDGKTLLGLHFAGISREENYALALAAMKPDLTDPNWPQMPSFAWR